MASNKPLVYWMPFHILFLFSMFLQNTFLAALLGFGVALLPNNAQAQSADSTFLIKPHKASAQAKDSAKAQAKIIRLVSQSTIPIGTDPLYVVDGRPIKKEEFKLINPADIDKIEIVKGSTAIAIYGSRATNGVVLMTMKHPDAKLLHQPDSKKARLN